MTSNVRTHPTDVDCGYQVVHADEGTLLQLSTYGSDARKSDKKVSQTLQVDRDVARQLIAVLRTAFPGI
jgi:5-methylcytosine-specific restriction protein B